jgi:hypothetical protein
MSGGCIVKGVKEWRRGEMCGEAEIACTNQGYVRTKGIGVSFGRLPRTSRSKGHSAPLNRKCNS